MHKRLLLISEVRWVRCLCDLIDDWGQCWYMLTYCFVHLAHTFFKQILPVHFSLFVHQHFTFFKLRLHLFQMFFDNPPVLFEVKFIRQLVPGADSSAHCCAIIRLKIKGPLINLYQIRSNDHFFAQNHPNKPVLVALSHFWQIEFMTLYDLIDCI